MQGPGERSDLLADETRNASTGVWRSVPMPADPGVPPDEANKLAAWMLQK